MEGRLDSADRGGRGIGAGRRKEETARRKPKWRKRKYRTVYLVDQEAVAQGVSEHLLGTPFILNEERTIEAPITEYLWARRNGDWQGAGAPGGIVAEASGMRVLRGSLKWLGSRAYQLDLFRRWCIWERRSYLRTDELDLEEFADEMEADGLGVRPQSINQYLIAIIDFLHFCAWRGWRDQLKLARRPSASGVGKLLVLRVEDVRDLRVWYTESDISSFLRELELGTAQFGGEILFRTGLRISELLAMETGRFPTPARFQNDRSARFLVVAGKGGKTRRVPLDLETCELVEEFENVTRHLYAGQAATQTDALILGPKRDGDYGPMSARYLQEQFARARMASGKDGITPHILRHHYAAHFLLRAWKDRSASAQLGASPAHLLSQELVLLKRAMGHARLETTMLYLDALPELVVGDLADEYSEQLEGTA